MGSEMCIRDSHYPSAREILTIATAGSTQNLRALAPTMVRLESIQYPYNADSLRMCSYPHTIVDAYTVVFYGVEPQPGEELLAVFNERHTLDGLFKALSERMDDRGHSVIVVAEGAGPAPVPYAVLVLGSV